LPLRQAATQAAVAAELTDGGGEEKRKEKVYFLYGTKGPTFAKWF